MGEHLSALILKDAFISYGRKESSDFAKRLQKRFKRESMYAWFDATDIPAAVDWQQRIYKGIDEAHNFIFIISPHAVKSQYCSKEIEYAVKRNKRIIPLLHVPPEENEISQTHSIIGEINWIPFIEGTNDFEESFGKLLQVIKKEDEYVKQHTDILLKAKTWEQNGYLNSMLLHSQEREKAEKWLKRKFKPEEGVCNACDLHAEYICESTKHANNFMTDVFFNSTQNNAVSDFLHRSLLKEGITTWKMNTNLSGVNITEAVRRGVQRASSILYFISPSELRNEIKQIELLRALDFRKRIIPIIIAPTQETLIPSEIRGLPRFKLSNLSPELHEEELTKLIRSLREEEEYFRLHRNFLVQSIKWKEQDENKSTLLQGGRLQGANDWLMQAKRRDNHLPTALHDEFINASLKRGVEIESEIFICYSRVDSDFVRKLNDELQIMGRTTWLDTESIAPGHDFETEIKNGIENSDNVLFVISPESIVSENCIWELEYAKSFNKRFINVLFRDPKNEPLPEPVGRIQWVDFRKQYRDFHKPLSELIRSVDNQRDHVREQTIWLKAAQKWAKHGKTYDRLLKGADFVDAEAWLMATRKNREMQQPTALTKEFIVASKASIERTKRRKARNQKLLISSLVFVTMFLLISVILGLQLREQAQTLTAQNKTIKQQKEDLFNKTKQLQQTIKEVQQAETKLRQQRAEIRRLQAERDSAAAQANSAQEREEVMTNYDVDILEKKDDIERDKVKAKQKAKQAQAKLEEIQKVQVQSQTKVQEVVADNVVDLTPNVPFFDDRAKDYLNGKWGFIDKSGIVVIPHQYDQVSDFSNGVAHVYKNGKQVFVDINGKKKTEWFDDIESFSDGIAEVKKGKKKSFINTRGELISKWFEEVYDFHYGRAKVMLNGKWGYIKPNGRFAISPMYDKAFQFRKGKKDKEPTAIVVRNNAKFKIDKDGKRVRGYKTRSLIPR